MTEKVNTGTYVSPEECEKVIQLFGVFHDSDAPDVRRANKNILNDYMQQLAVKYKMKKPWFEYEISPGGEFVHVTREAGDAAKFNEEFGNAPG